MPLDARLLYICCCLLCFESYSIAQNTPISEIERSVVQIVIMSPSEGGALPMGSGFFAGDGKTIVSAAHVYWQAGLSGNQRHLGGIFASKTLPSGKRFMVQITPGKVDDAHDLAVFTFDPTIIKTQLPDFVIKPLAVSEQDPKAGDEVALFGYIGLYSFVTSVRGWVSGEIKTPTPPLVFIDETILGIGVNFGDSGGPVVSTSTGKVVGVVTGFLPMTTTTPGQSTLATGVSRAAKSSFLSALLHP